MTIGSVRHAKASGIVNLTVAARPGFDEWQARYLLGEVPDEWPYGLNRLQDPSVRLSHIDLAAQNRLLGSLGRRRRVSPFAPLAGVLVCWDELTAIDALTRGVKTDALVSGIIWGTDHANRVSGLVKRHILKYYLRRLDAAWCLSEPQVELARAWLGPGGPNIVHLPFGIDVDFFQYQPYPGGRPLVLSAGNDPDRDLGVLLEACEWIYKRRPNVEIVIQTNKKVKSIPRGVRIVNSMSHTELRDLYRRASVVVAATRPNAHVSGMTLALEAQAVGRPVVMTNTIGMNKYVRTGETGLLVAAERPAELGNAVLSVLADHSGAEAMGRRGNAFVLRSHDSGSMAIALRKIALGVIS